jgi:hypothetical protein
VTNDTGGRTCEPSSSHPDRSRRPASGARAAQRVRLPRPCRVADRGRALRRDGLRADERGTPGRAPRRPDRAGGGARHEWLHPSAGPLRGATEHVVAGLRPPLTATKTLRKSPEHGSRLASITRSCAPKAQSYRASAVDPRGWQWSSTTATASGRPALSTGHERVGDTAAHQTERRRTWVTSSHSAR